MNTTTPAPAYAPKPDPVKTMSTYYKYFESAMKSKNYDQAHYYGNLMGRIRERSNPTNAVDKTHMNTLMTAVNNTYKANPMLQQAQYNQ